jgi:hypothetical protein
MTAADSAFEMYITQGNGLVWHSKDQRSGWLHGICLTNLTYVGASVLWI